MIQIEEELAFGYFKEIGYKDAANGFVIDNNVAEDIESKFYNLTGVRFASCDEDLIKASYAGYFNGYFGKKAEEWVKMWKNSTNE